VLSDRLSIVRRSHIVPAAAAAGALCWVCISQEHACCGCCCWSYSTYSKRDPEIFLLDAASIPKHPRARQHGAAVGHCPNRCHIGPTYDQPQPAIYVAVSSLSYSTEIEMRENFVVATAGMESVSLFIFRTIAAHCYCYWAHSMGP